MIVRERWRERLGSPRLPLLAALLAALFTLPSLGSGLATEDYVFRAATRGPLTWRSLNVFGGPELPNIVDVGRAQGILPWFAPDDLHLAFWRPLTSLTHHFDYRVLGDAVWLMHLESVALYAALAFIAAHLYRRLCESRTVAGLAGLLFALDGAHGHAVGWLANRNAILAALFGLLALWFHDRWRRDGARLGAWLAPIATALALLSGELGLGVLAYIGAHAAFIDRRPRRLAAVLPVAAVATAWAIAYHALGYGARASGIYLDPLRQPLELAAALPDRLGTLLLGQLATPPADAWSLLAAGPRRALPIAGFVVTGALVAQSRRSNGPMRFFWLGGLGALLPTCATFPSDRLLALGGLGLLGAVATVIVDGAAWVRVALVALHLVVAPLSLPLRVRTMEWFHDRVSRLSTEAFVAVRQPEQILVLLRAPDDYQASLVWLLHVHEAGAPPSPMITLAGTCEPVSIVRVDQNTLEVRAAEGFLVEPFNQIYRPRSRPMRAGDKVFVRSAEVEITETFPSGEPRAARFRFIWPLDSRQLVFADLTGCSWRDGYRSVPPP